MHTSGCTRCTQTPTGCTDTVTPASAGTAAFVSPGLVRPVGARCVDRVHFVGGVLLARSMTRVVALGAVAVLSLAACANNAEEPGGEAGAKEVIVSMRPPAPGRQRIHVGIDEQHDRALPGAIGNKAGDYTIKLKPYDDSTAAKGAWDDATCAKNATDHVANDRRGRGDGHLQLRLRQDRGADAQPGPHRPDADGVARQHQPRPDQDLGARASRRSTTRPATATTPAS